MQLHFSLKRKRMDRGRCLEVLLAQTGGLPIVGWRVLLQLGLVNGQEELALVLVVELAV